MYTHLTQKSTISERKHTKQTKIVLIKENIIHFLQVTNFIHFSSIISMVSCLGGNRSVLYTPQKNVLIHDTVNTSLTLGFKKSNTLPISVFEWSNSVFDGQIYHG